ncbi:unnamed protein product [Vicia faba]|uniref:peptidylprolyl isomerase n=1 Tax=Vicia faba TaxID=3906 RepID=A0AAV1BCR6_VICFA|nr:unnamed protein product [Vicia faba]
MTISDITKDGKVLKKILKEGDGYERPNDGAVVQVKLIGKLQDGTVFLKKGHDDDQPFEFKINEEQVIHGLDRAVKLHWWSYSPIELVSFVKEKESWDMNTQEKIEAAVEKKEEGNALFKAGKYERASKRYEKAMKYIEYDSTFSDEEKQQAKPLKITCNLNSAACKLKLKDYKQTEKFCTKVLELDSRNVKALYHIKKALEIDPDNRDVKIEYKILKEKVREYSKKDAQFYGNIFAKMNKVEQARTAEAKQEPVAMAVDSKA